MSFYKANDKYSATLSSGYTVGQTTLSVNVVPDNVPTLVVVAKGTTKETIFIVTNKTVNSLTGVSRLKGYVGDLDAQMPVTCLNNEEFINQYSAAVSTPESLIQLLYAVDGGSTDTYVISLDVVPTAYTEGMMISFKANTTNVGACTLNVNGLGAKAIKVDTDVDPANGDIKAGQVVVVIYDGTNFQLQTDVPTVIPISASFWTAVVGTYASATTFTVPTDLTGIFKKGVGLKWLSSADALKVGKVVSSSYSAPNTTVVVVGSAVASGDKSFNYGADVMSETFIVPGNQSTGTNVAKTWMAKTGIYPISVDAMVGTAGTTNSTDYDVNDDGTTIIATKPSIASTATTDLDNVTSAPTTEVAVGSLVTVDIDAASTTQAIDGYITLFFIPTWWINRV